MHTMLKIMLDYLEQCENIYLCCQKHSTQLLFEYGILLCRLCTCGLTSYGNLYELGIQFQNLLYKVKSSRDCILSPILFCLWCTNYLKGWTIIRCCSSKSSKELLHMRMMSEQLPVLYTRGQFYTRLCNSKCEVMISTAPMLVRYIVCSIGTNWADCKIFRKEYEAIPGRGIKATTNYIVDSRPVPIPLCMW